jgi:hypothetical protein
MAYYIRLIISWNLFFEIPVCLCFVTLKTMPPPRPTKKKNLLIMTIMKTWKHTAYRVKCTELFNSKHITLNVGWHITHYKDSTRQCISATWNACRNHTSRHTYPTSITPPAPTVLNILQKTATYGHGGGVGDCKVNVKRRQGTYMKTSAGKNN